MQESDDHSPPPAGSSPSPPTGGPPPLDTAPSRMKGPLWAKIAAGICAVVVLLAVIAACSSDDGENEPASKPTPTASAEVKNPLTADEQAYVDMVSEDAAKVADNVQTISKLAAKIPWDYEESMEIGAAVGEIKASRDYWKWTDPPSARLAPFRKEWNAALSDFAKAGDKLEYANDHSDADAFSQATKLIRHGLKHAQRATEEMNEISAST